MANATLNPGGFSGVVAPTYQPMDPKLFATPDLTKIIDRAVEFGFNMANAGTLNENKVRNIEQVVPSGQKAAVATNDLAAARATTDIGLEPKRGTFEGLRYDNNINEQQTLVPARQGLEGLQIGSETRAQQAVPDLETDLRQGKADQVNFEFKDEPVYDINKGTVTDVRKKIDKRTGQVVAQSVIGTERPITQNVNNDAGSLVGVIGPDGKFTRTSLAGSGTDNLVKVIDPITGQPKFVRESAAVGMTPAMGTSAGGVLSGTAQNTLRLRAGKVLPAETIETYTSKQDWNGLAQEVGRMEGENKTLTKLTQAERNDLGGGLEIASFLETLVPEYDKQNKGPLGGNVGPINAQLSKLGAATGIGADQDFTKFRSGIQNNTMKLARILNGPGVLTEQDVARAEAIAASINQPRETFVGNVRAQAQTAYDGLLKFESSRVLSDEDKQKVGEAKAKLLKIANGGTGGATTSSSLPDLPASTIQPSPAAAAPAPSQSAQAPTFMKDKASGKTYQITGYTQDGKPIGILVP